MLIFLQKTWLFVKKHWQLFLLVVGAIVAVILFRKQSTSFVDQYKQIQDAHDAELKKIEDAQKLKEQQDAANEKQLKDALTAIQKQYDQQMQALDDKKKAQVEQIVSQYGNDPDELAKQLSSVTGFQVILPK